MNSMMTQQKQASTGQVVIARARQRQKSPIRNNESNYSFSGFPIQTKLTIGSTNDKYEREADAMADRIMRMPMESASRQPLSSSSPTIQTKCAACEHEEDKIQRKPLMMKSEGGTPVATQALGAQLNSTKGSGSPLPSGTNSFMGQSFGTDFSHVRVHSGSSAIQMNQGLNARAFTHGSDVYFNSGQYQPGSSEGKRLLGHELTHVVQQTNANSEKNFNTSNSSTIQRTLGDGHDLLAPIFQKRLDLEKAYDNEKFVRKGARGADVVILQLVLIEEGFSLPLFGADGRFETETETAVKKFQQANGLQSDGIVGPKTMEALDKKFMFNNTLIGKIAALLNIPFCAHPGIARNLELQPVFLRSAANDPDPTGGIWVGQLTKANEIWSKLGVTFTQRSNPVMITNAAMKTSGTTNAQQNALGALHNGPGIEVVFVDNALANAGGASTLGAGNNSNVVMSDFTTADTILAHELGHVLSNGGGHPPATGVANSIMVPSGSPNVANPDRNPIGNLPFILFPPGRDPICLRPDP